MNIRRIQHFVRGGKSARLYRLDIKLPYRVYSFQYVFALVRVGLGKHSLVTHSPRPRLVRVYPRNEHKLVLYPIVEPAQPFDVLQNGLLLVRRARPYYHYQLFTLARYYFRYQPVALSLDPFQVFGQRHFVGYFFRFGYLYFLVKHFFLPSV